jgi:hypothetical protein
MRRVWLKFTSILLTKDILQYDFSAFDFETRFCSNRKDHPWLETKRMYEAKQ